MKKGICMLLVLIMCVGTVLPAYAVGFVPSITYKSVPEVIGGVLKDLENAAEELDIQGCIVVTSITQAEKKETDITQEARDLLLETYEKLSNGAMDLFEFAEESADPEATTPETPTMGLHYGEKDFVVIQLVDVSLAKKKCIDDPHGHKEILEREDVNAVLDFDLGVSADAVVVVLHFHEGKWIPVERTVNNGDGTVTCEFEHFCPVAFCIEAEEQEAPVKADFSWVLWLILLLACAAAIVVLVILRQKNKKKGEEEA